MSDEIVYIFKCSPEVEKLIKSLSEHVPGGEETLLQKSLILMGIVVRAKKLGHRLAITDKEDNVLDHIDI
jgi:hypothetical protein